MNALRTGPFETSKSLDLSSKRRTPPRFRLILTPGLFRLDNGKMDHRASEGVPGLGRVYVMFDQQESAHKAMTSLAGRQFSGRTIIVAYEKEDIMLS